MDSEFELNVFSILHQHIELKLNWKCYVIISRTIKTPRKTKEIIKIKKSHGIIKCVNI
jgi:ACT domain-containing protein